MILGSWGPVDDDAHAWRPWARVLQVPRKKTRREALGSSLRLVLFILLVVAKCARITSKRGFQTHAVFDSFRVRQMGEIQGP